jgi:hypothetical protein
MNLNKKYHDSNDNECNIIQMFRTEPEWAGNIIQYYENKLAESQSRTCENCKYQTTCVAIITTGTFQDYTVRREHLTYCSAHEVAR